LKDMLIKVIKLLLLVGILYYIFHGIDIEVLWHSLETLSLPFVFLAAFLYFSHLALFGSRWYYITNHECPPRASFEVVFVAFFVNTFIPAKMGEVSRVFYLRKFYNYPTHKTLSAIFYEKLFDMMFLSFLLILAAYVFFEDSSVSWMAVGILGSVILFLIAFARYEEAVWRVLHKVPHKSIRVFLKKMFKALRKKNTLKDFLVTTGLTFLIRLVNFFVVVALFRYAAHMSLSMEQLAVLFVATTVADFLPLAPGGTGVLHAAVVFVLTKYGIDKDTALASAIIYHLLINMTPALVALVILSQKRITFASLMEKKRTAQPS